MEEIRKRGMEKVGESSVSYMEKITLIGKASVVGKKEGEGPLGGQFDYVATEDIMGESSWEAAESSFQRKALELAVEKAGDSFEQIDFLCAGDLLGQSMATSFGAGSSGIPFFGLYGACSTSGESLLVASMLLAGGYGKKAACVTSSHFASAEKEFRYPLEYGNQRPLSATWTVTGSGAFVLSAGNPEEKGVNICGGTIGKIVDYGCKDSMNMGACMAPAACETMERHFLDYQRRPGDYDRIITGDLGVVGSEILWELMKEKGYDIKDKHLDCGRMIFNEKEQDTHSGGSGCGCAAVVLAAEILPRMLRGEWRRVLFMPTGAMLSKTSFNEGNTIPAISHAVLLEAQIPG